MTIRQIVAEINLQLAGRYNEREIESFVRILFRHFMNMNAAEMQLSNHRVPSVKLRQQIVAAVDELKKKRPIQYILGETEFYGMKFVVTPDVLVPRPETEELVDWVVREYGSGAELSVADIGTGSGCIAVALKSNFPNAQVWAVDISEQALEVAQQNALKNDVELNFLKADILKDRMMSFEPNSLDLVVSNPPYVTPAEKKRMSENVLENEPHIALFTPKNDPLIFFKLISSFALNCLKNHGKIFFEINEKYPGEVADILKQNGFSDISIRKDINGKWRMISAKTGTGKR